MRDIWREAPDLRPYSALVPGISLDERNAPRSAGSGASARLDFSAEDRVNDDLFNHILWTAIKGAGVPYPGARAASAPEWTRAARGAR